MAQGHNGTRSRRTSCVAKIADAMREPASGILEPARSMHMSRSTEKARQSPRSPLALTSALRITST